MTRGSVSFGQGGRPLTTKRRDSETKATRCCARCRTPYNCGNPSCRCHPTTKEHHDR